MSLKSDFLKRDIRRT